MRYRIPENVFKPYSVGPESAGLRLSPCRYGYLTHPWFLCHTLCRANHVDRFFRAARRTHPATDAFRLINAVNSLWITGNSVHRAYLGADIDAGALRRVDMCLGAHRNIIMDRAGGAFFNTESADDALAVIDTRQIVVDLNGIHRAGPNADAAGDASDLAFLS